MPIYEYRCDQCRHQFDLFQKITDDPVSECPECGGPVQKLVSQTSFVLKGGGWYATEYGNRRPPKNEPAAEKPAAARQEGAKKDSKKDSKAAAA